MLGRRVCGEINISAGPRAAPGLRFLPAWTEDALCAADGIGPSSAIRRYAEYITLPLENLHIVPDGVSDEQAVFVEPLAAACEILEQVDVKEIPEAAVLGDGKLTQLIARVLRTAIPRVVMYGKHKQS